MKIVHVITRLIVGGAQENTLLSCEGQHKLGHDVTLITGPSLGPEGSLMDRARAGGYRVITVDAMRRAILPGKDFRVYAELKRLYRHLDPDVIHTHSSKAGIVGRWAGHAVKNGKKPAIIHTIHGLAFTASKKKWVNTSYRLLEKITAPLTDKIVCVADAMTEQSLAGGVGKAGQYVTVYSGMAIQPFLNPPVAREIVRQGFGIKPEHVVVGTIARLFELKGHDDLLDLAPGLCLRFPQLRFLWVGDGLLRESFERRIREMGLTDRFVLTGLVPPTKIPELANAMDLLAHPSRREGLARALPQAALCGIPGVTYDIDGAKEGVLNGRTGYVVPPFDVPAFGRAIESLVEDETKRKSMGDAGRAFAVGRFAANKMVADLQRVYESVTIF